MSLSASLHLLAVLAGSLTNSHRDFLLSLSFPCSLRVLFCSSLSSKEGMMASAVVRVIPILPHLLPHPLPLRICSPSEVAAAFAPCFALSWITLPRWQRCVMFAACLLVVEVGERNPHSSAILPLLPSPSFRSISFRSVSLSALLSCSSSFLPPSLSFLFRSASLAFPLFRSTSTLAMLGLHHVPRIAPSASSTSQSRIRSTLPNKSMYEDNFIASLFLLLTHSSVLLPLPVISSCSSLPPALLRSSFWKFVTLSRACFASSLFLSFPDGIQEARDP